MARKKTEEVVEEVVEVEVVEEPTVEESVVEEKPKAKRTTKKKTEEVSEESIAEPVVEEKPKKTVKKVVKEDEPTKEPKYETGTELSVAQVVDILGADTFEPYRATVISSAISVRKGPGLTFHHIRYLNKDMKVTVLEVSGNWGRIGKDMWININYIEKV